MSYTDISNVYLYGNSEHKNYPVDVVDVNVTAATQIGDIIDAAGDLIVAAAEGTARYIIIDERVVTGDGLAAGTHALKVLARDCGVGESYIQVAAGADLAAAKTALEAFGMKFESQLS